MVTAIEIIRRCKGLGFIFCLWMVGTPHAFAAWAPVPLEVLAQEADLIAVVRVLQVESATASNSATATLELIQVLKSPAGFSASTVAVQFSSGRLASGSTARYIRNSANFWIKH